MSARDAALRALIACRRQGVWPDRALDREIGRAGLDRRDAALATRLLYGVLQNQMLLDFYLAQFLRPDSHLQPQVEDILRLGAFQLVFCEKIPASAAVNEAAEQAKQLANRPAAGLVNAVLRNFVRNQNRLPEPPDLATRYSHPRPLVELLRRAVGPEKLEALLAADNAAPEMTVQANTLKVSEEELIDRLRAEGIGVERHRVAGLNLKDAGSLEHLDAFQEGLFYVQDAAAKLAVDLAGAGPGMCVLDCCAAPGGKSFAGAIAMQNRGRITACDIHAHKLRRIRQGADRLGISILTEKLWDATQFCPEWAGQMDVVIADVPCSGLGVIRKKPDIRQKDLSQISQLPALQRSILDNQARYVKPDGVLLYSTCTVLPEENEGVIDAFLAGHAGSFHVEAMRTLLPCDDDTDGFFICKLRRTH